LTLPTSKETITIRLHCVGTVIRLEARPRRAIKDKDKPFQVTTTLKRYEFIQNNR
jgi:hypothetical protein